MSRTVAPTLITSSPSSPEVIQVEVVTHDSVIPEILPTAQVDRQRPAPKQTEIKNKLVNVTTELARLRAVKTLRLATDDTLTVISKLEKENSALTGSLKRLEKSAEYNIKSRKRKKEQLEKLQELVPDAQVVKAKPGPWPLESTQPELLKCIVDIIMTQSSADERRRCSVLRTCQTLDDLHQALLEKGFFLSRTSLYHRILPKRANSNQGKRHVTTVPVKLVKATATQRKKHQDAHFAMATVNFLKNLAIVLGPGPVFYLSQDDKCRVPIGLPAATKQSPFLMMMEQRVTLPDHDFVVASRHKLIPSVYASAKITSTSVSYSGPTYIAIRSGKHDTSNAATHAMDFDMLFNLESFKDDIKAANGKMKPVVIVSVDGGPDENPRFDTFYQTGY